MSVIVRAVGRRYNVTSHVYYVSSQFHERSWNRVQSYQKIVSSNLIIDGSRQFRNNSFSSVSGESKRRLDVAIVGAPNSGKSQLLNAIMGTTVAAVSRKRHTTRSGILAAYTHNDTNTQLVFVDTPGFLRLDDKMKQKGGGKKAILQTLMKSSMKEMELADYTLIVIDAAKKISDDMKTALAVLMMRAAATKGRLEKSDSTITMDDEYEDVRDKFAIVLNKVDLVNPKKKLLDIATELGIMGDSAVKHIYYTEKQNTEEEEEHGRKNALDYIISGGNDNQIDVMKVEDDDLILDSLYPPVFFISALKDDGVEDLLNHLITYATPCKEWALPPDSVTDMTDAERVEEIIREKLYRCLHREVPHQIEQVNRLLLKMPPEEETRLVRIDQDLIVRTKSHATLVNGKGGMTLKRIQETATQDLLQLFKCPVQLNLHVKWKKSKQSRGNEVSSDRMGIVQRSL